LVPKQEVGFTSKQGAQQSRLAVKERTVFFTSPWFLVWLLTCVVFVVIGAVLQALQRKKTEKAAVYFLHTAYEGIAYEAASESRKQKKFQAYPRWRQTLRLFVELEWWKLKPVSELIEKIHSSVEAEFDHEITFEFMPEANHWTIKQCRGTVPKSG
jgi:hypothetical protein